MSESLESTYPHWYAWGQFLICFVAAAIPWETSHALYRARTGTNQKEVVEA